MPVTVSSPNAPESDEGGQRSAALADPASFGQFLAAARHRSGLSLEDISAATKIAVRHLEALEHGDFDQLPGGVYRRAWVKSYAAAVGLPPEAAIELFDRTCAPPPAPAEGRLATPGPRPESSPPPPALMRGAVDRYHLLEYMLSAAVLVAAASVALLLRSEPSAPGLPERLDGVPPSVGGDSRVLTADSGARAATRGDGSRHSDIALVPDEIPEEPIPDPRLVIRSRPSGARVTVNGIGWGVTPVTIRHLPPGSKRIRATKDGYIGRETNVEFDLTGSGKTVRLILERQE